MDEWSAWMKTQFNALTSKRISRNKHFTAFSSGWGKIVLKRFRIIHALKRESERLIEIPGSSCWISSNGRGLQFHLDCPRLSYRREVTLRGFEWEWLGQQSAVQALLSAKTLEN